MVDYQTRYCNNCRGKTRFFIQETERVKRLTCEICGKDAEVIFKK